MLVVVFQFITKKANADLVHPISSTISTTGQLSVGKVAPGEQLPLQVQLINFGTPNESIDVTLTYSIRNDKNIVVLESAETVAVQTTSSFIKNVLIPMDFSTGTYTIDLLMTYKNQEFPAISKAKFKIKNRFLGFYTDDWFAAGPIMFVPLLLMFFWLKRKKEDQKLLRPHYAHIAEEERTYYEMIHDIVVCIHKHVGDKKMQEIVDHIEGLTLDSSNLYVEELSGSIEEIISKLIYEYENIIGKKANIITKAVYPKNRVKTH